MSEHSHRLLFSQLQPNNQSMSMISTNIKCVLAAALLSLCAQSSYARSAENASNPDWTIHSSFYNQPRRILDTPSRVYFFVHTTPYDTQSYSRYYNKAGGSIFYLDKNNPDKGIQDLARQVSFTGFDMVLAEVDPQTNTLAVAYEDGGIDLISPAGKVNHLNALKEAPDYYLSTVIGLEFEPGANTLFVCTAGGFVSIDTTTGEIKVLADWRERVYDIVRCGDGYLAIIDNKLYESKPGADLSRRDSFVELRGLNNNVPLRLLSFSDSYAGFVCQNGTVYLLKKNNGSWSREMLLDRANIVKSNSQVVVNVLEHNVQKTTKGYMISSPEDIYMISIDANSEKPTVKKLGVPANTTTFAGSYNGNDFWFFTKSDKFIAMSHDGSAWKESSEAYSVSAPHTAKDVHFIYSPTHGFLAINKEAGMKGSVVDRVMPLTIASYRNGAWTDLSPRKDVPYFVEADPSLLNRYLSDSYKWYPLNSANGAVIDPLHPDVLLGGSTWDGIAGVYLDDPRKTPHVHVVGDSPNLNLNAVRMFPTSTWGRYAGLYIMGVDADNNIWATRSNLRNADNTANTLAQVWVLTPDARQEAFENDQPSLCGQWKRMEVDGNFYTEFYAMGKVLKHPKNKNKILLSGQVNNGKGRPLRIYNTNGTFDTSADDTLVDVNYFRRDDGSKGSAQNITAYFEDPSTGEIYVFCGDDLFIIDLDSPVTSNTMDAKSLSLKTEDGNIFVPFSIIQGYDACQDEYGRLWVATSKFGVYGITADRTRLVAHYCMENSPLPSNAVYGVGWNPETQSLFISTDVAICEVKVDSPESSSSSTSGMAPFAVPRSVTPDYTGTVAIHNVPKATALRVRDTDGKTVALINDVKDGVAFWDLTDTEGEAVPTGTYTIVDASGTPAFESIILPVIR